MAEWLLMPEGFQWKSFILSARAEAMNSPGRRKRRICFHMKRG